MTTLKKNNRKYDRFDTEVKVYFRVEYDIETKIEYQVVGKEIREKHFGVTKNVSTEGMCFTSYEKLQKGDILSMELYLPEDEDKPVYMLGEVRWSNPTEKSEQDGKKYETGVKLITVNNQNVNSSTYFDTENNLYWSPVLESVFGKFKLIQLKKKSMKG